jgi:CBS domain-containing protein
MIICPDCGHENIAGADTCEECEQPLSPLSKPTPASDIERGLLEDSIEVLSPRRPLTVSPDMPVGEVLQILVKNSIGCVLVVQGDEVIGIFSERDALMRLNVDAAELFDQPVSQFMTPSPETLEATDKIAFALHKMDLGGYRHVPILKQGKVCGVISIRDILRYMTDNVAAQSPA